MKKKFLCALLILAMLLPICVPANVDAATISPTGTTSNEEFKAVWFSYYDYEPFLKKYSNTGTNFKKYFDTVLDTCKKNGFNRIIVQVRPFSDAMYKSSYFPTSAYIAKKQGGSLSYNPLSIMVTEAHKKGLKIEAWINPYRVASHTSYSKLAANNPARKWHYSLSASTRRNVLSYGGKLYYNPSKPAVRKLIINGVKEIVKKYDVDGIHMDDYFYPSFTSKNYNKTFDATEYNKSSEKKSGMSIQAYRRKQVNLLVSGIRSAIKSIDKNVTFGISPAGNIDNLTSKYQYYVDIKKWCNSTSYVDYIAPQIYWGFNHKTAKFDQVLNRWKSITNQSKVKLYVGLPAYRMGYNEGSTTAEKREFKTSTTLAKMIRYGRTKKVNGFIVFDYQDLTRSAIKSHISNMAKELKK